MKYVIAIAGLLAGLAAAGQKKLPVDKVYPLLKDIKTKALHASFDECVTGDCANGEGTRIILGTEEPRGAGYKIEATVLKGRFSNNGADFTGKLYKPEIGFAHNSKTKELVRDEAFDFTNEQTMQPFYIGDGPYKNKPMEGWDGWDGVVNDVPALKKAFPKATVHKAVFRKNSLNWIDISFPATERVTRYTGRTMGSGDFLWGKAELNNGDSYEGFFFLKSFYGPGRLTSKGKIKQGIWQLNSLLEEMPIELAPVLFEPSLPEPIKLNGGFNFDGLVQSSPLYYGEASNNAANGWGLMSVTFKGISVKQLGGWAYGKWEQNQLQTGIYFNAPSAGWLQFGSGEKNSMFNDIRFAAGFFNNNELVRGTTLTTNYQVHSNRELTFYDIPRLNLEGYQHIAAGSFQNGQLNGCGLKMDLFYERPQSVSLLQEGNFVNHRVSGFYFEGDTAKTRSLKFLNYYYGAKITGEIIKEAEADTRFCLDEIKNQKLQYITWMRKKLNEDIASIQFQNSPEGQAHARRIAQENEAYAKNLQGECDAMLKAKGYRKGITYSHISRGLIIFESMDCGSKKLRFWSPTVGKEEPGRFVEEDINSFFVKTSDKQYQTCTNCEGTGRIGYTEYVTKTKELPWGYFSGIETKRISTKAIQRYKICDVCHGAAIVLR